MVERLVSRSHSENETTSGKRAKMVSPLSIQLMSGFGKKYRRGELHFLRQLLQESQGTAATPDKVILQTPGLLVYTRKLSVPHITYDMYDAMKLTSSLLHLNTECCILDMPDAFPGDLTHFVKPLANHLKLWTAFDPLKAEGNLLKHGKTFVQIKTDMGRQKIMAREYMKVATKWKPDCIASLAAPSSLEEKSRNQAQKIFKRWEIMLDECMSETSGSGIPLLATLTSSNTEYLLRTADTVVQHLDALHGVVVNTQLSDVSTVTDALPTSIPRFHMGVMTPDEILLHLGHLDFFPSSFCHLLADAGYAMNLNLDHLEWNSFPHLQDERFREEMRNVALDNPCPCWACQHHNAAYLFHLFDCHEMLGLTLLSIHNLVQLDQFLCSVRKSIDSGTAQEKIDRFLSYFNENLKLMQTTILDQCLRHVSNKRTSRIDREE